MSAEDFRERRRYPRVKSVIALELHYPGIPAPFRTTTTEVSLGGCYIETMFTLDIGTKVNMLFWLDDCKVAAKGVVATRFPQVGNGIEIVEMTAEDRQAFEAYLTKASVEA
jgi:PilZ domain